MPAIPKENVQASTRLKDPTHAKQHFFDVDSSESIATPATKKRKRDGSRSMSSSMETISPGLIHSNTSKTSHKRSPKEAKRDNSATKSAMSREMQQCTSPEPTGLELPPKPSSEQKAVNDNVSTNTNPFGLAGLPPSEFVFPRDVDLGLFDYPSDERETSYELEPVSECLPEQRDEVPTPYTPVLRAVSQYNQRIWSQCGAKCETWLARQMYYELDDISIRIEDIMRGIRAMLEMRGPSDDFDGLGEHHFEAEESHGSFKGGGPEDPWELSDEDDSALFVSGTDELSSSDEFSGFSGDE
ncbi:hypothetical protein N7519_010722 [Penicillium mononematosum]|uniref:uncharacterized protein n=1 Tax=Penicillium mononematosum TaxID=268346 RepID=UPI002548DAAF|nr:uncharacterized protein N7519_010722 [Penicillium mononematosum]KAJ6180261.1 hypothetical protein N7519_010722 [Penicillium mononematosum]